MPSAGQSHKAGHPAKATHAFRHAKSHSSTKTSVPKQNSQQTKPKLTDDDLNDLPKLLREQAGFEPRSFQLSAIKAQLRGINTLVHAGTGSGKTFIATGPYVHPSSKGKLTIMVSPLIALHNEQVMTFQDKFKLSTVALNSTNGGCTREIVEGILNGTWQIILISPEMLQSATFIREVLKQPAFKRRILSVVINEAHVVSSWGSGFRKKYGTLGTISAFLPKGTAMVAVSATLSPRVRRDIISKLQLGKDFISIDIGNDRPNVSIIVRAIHNPMNTFADLDLVVNGVSQIEDIKKTFIYCDNIATGTDIIDHLKELLPGHLKDTVRPYNALFSQDFRNEVMALL